MIDEHDRALLQAIYQLMQPTVEDLRHYALPGKPTLHLYRKLAKLLDHQYVARELLYPERGARSPRYYHLLLKGAKAIGLPTLSSQHYRHLSREAFHAQHIKRELALLAAHQGWKLINQENECQRLALSLLQMLARQHYGEAFPRYALYLPTLKISPDLLLDTGKHLFFVIIGHPLAGPAFWRKRIERYQPLIHAISAICFVLSDQQEAEAKRAIAASPYAKRFLILPVQHVRSLIQRLPP